MLAAVEGTVEASVPAVAEEGEDCDGYAVLRSEVASLRALVEQLAERIAVLEQ